MAQTNHPTPETLQRLIAAAGDGGSTQDQARIAPHLVEWRERFHGTTPLLLMPSSTAAIASIVRICNDTRTALVPQGGNTGLAGGQIPNPNGNEILLSLSRLDRVRTIDPLANTMTVEAGAILEHVQRQADAHERLFPLSLASEGSATIVIFRRSNNCRSSRT